MSKESQRIFKLQLQLKKQQTNKNLKIRKSSKWLFPSAYIRQYKTFLKALMKKYTDLTLSLFPLLEDWQKEVKQINDGFIDNKAEIITIDTWEEELETTNKEQYENLFTEEKDSIKSKLSTLGLLIFAFNRKQFDKIITQSLGVEHFNYEAWESTFLNAWTNRNVNLIKGLTEEYRKKIMDTIIDNYQRGVRLEELKNNLIKINKEFNNGKPTTIFKLKDGTRLVYKNEDIKKSKKLQEKIANLKKENKVKTQTTGRTQSRVDLIARDQISKINGQLSAQRQKDAGIDTYWWETSRDERVRKTHRAMQGKLCRWDDPTVYSDDMGKTWKSRASIGGVLLHPQEDYQCRCIAIPNFEPLVNEINSTQESLLG